MGVFVLVIQERQIVISGFDIVVQVVDPVGEVTKV